MTGFGRGEAANENASAEVEIRSVNNRFCDVSVRLPRYLGAYEYEIQQIVRQSVGRGKINVHVRVEQKATSQSRIQIDTESAKAHRAMLDELRETTGVNEDVRLEHVLSFSDIFTQNDEDDNVQGSWAAAQQALTAALKEFSDMRLGEGKVLADDLKDRLGLMSQALSEIEARAPERVEEAIERLRTRITSLMEDAAVDETRLATEVALLADRFDITEECVRLRSHLTVFQEALDGTESPGRKLNFLTQEMHREVNTIGSKANDFSISNQSVILKEELERIREQVQNIQ
jgi:uncharacterized protein (TIGR00255 family)